jgi:hypothetical protein
VIMPTVVVRIGLVRRENKKTKDVETSQKKIFDAVRRNNNISKFSLMVDQYLKF